MPDSISLDTERIVQRPFSKVNLFSYLAMALAVLGFDRAIDRLPDRTAAPLRLAETAYRPLQFDPGGFAPLRLAGAWRVSVGDGRFGGVSGLALDDGRLVALTDSGSVAYLPRPGKGTHAWIRDLPAGPGSPAFKSGRDSEALLHDPGGRGWWVAFENRHQLWLFDRWFQRALDRIDLGRDMRVNTGIEALAAEGSTLLAFPESGDGFVRIVGGKAARQSLDNRFGRVSDATRLPDGRLLLLSRNLGPTGFANRLLVMDNGRARLLAELPLGRLENAEGLAAEALPDGKTRIWVITDNGFRRRLPTLLLALDLPKGS